MDTIQWKHSWYNPSYLNNSERWTLLHSRPAFENEVLEIPEEYKKWEKDGVKVTRVHYDMYYYSDARQAHSNASDELNATQIVVSRRSSGNRGEVIIEIKGSLIIKKKMSGEPPEGFDKPTPPYVPPGGGMPEDAFDPSNDPDINVPEPDPVDPSGGEPEIPPMEPDITPEPEPEPEPDPSPDADPDKSTDPEPDKPEVDPGDNDEEKPEDFD